MIFDRKQQDVLDGKVMINNEIEWVNMNYIPFGEKSMLMLIRMYQETADLETVINNDILYELIKVNEI